MADDILPEGIDALLGMMARALLDRGAALEARLVAEGRANLLTLSDGYHLALRVPEALHRRLGLGSAQRSGAPSIDRQRVKDSEERIRRCAQQLLEPLMLDKIKPVRVSVTAMLAPPGNWREHTRQLLTPEDPLARRPRSLTPPPAPAVQPATTEDFSIKVGRLGVGKGS